MEIKKTPDWHDLPIKNKFDDLTLDQVKRWRWAYEAERLSIVRHLEWVNRELGELERRYGVEIEE